MMRRFASSYLICWSAVEVFLNCLPVGPVWGQGLDRAFTKKRNNTPASADSSTCISLYWKGSRYVSNGMWNLGKDTLEYFVESCPLDANAPGALGYLPGAVSGLASQSEWLAFREWLFKVLYLNPDSVYYCTDAEDLISTFNYVDGSRGDDMRGRIAVENFIVNSGKCPYLVESIQKSMQKQWQLLHDKWLSSGDTSTPFDSTLPTLQDIGFELLLGPQYAVEHHGAMPSSVLGTIESSPNPFTSDAEIRYTLNVPASLTVEVFDLLGKKVTTLVPSVMTTNGDYILKLPGTSLASGTYYVRFTVPEGEVRTLKLTKE